VSLRGWEDDHPRTAQKRPICLHLLALRSQPSIDDVACGVIAPTYFGLSSLCEVSLSLPAQVGGGGNNIKMGSHPRTHLPGSHSSVDEATMYEGASSRGNTSSCGSCADALDVVWVMWVCPTQVDQPDELPCLRTSAS